MPPIRRARWTGQPWASRVGPGTGSHEILGYDSSGFADPVGGQQGPQAFTDPPSEGQGWSHEGRHDQETGQGKEVGVGARDWLRQLDRNASSNHPSPADATRVGMIGGEAVYEPIAHMLAADFHGRG